MTNNPIPPQVIEKWQAEFEQLLHGKYPHLSLNKTPLDKYAYMGTEALWQGFMLARSTVEIELPAWSMGTVFSQACAEMIREQGYRVRGEG